jgi:hypothetical protein
MTASPPPTENFPEVPIVTWEAYEYSPHDAVLAEDDRHDMPGTPSEGQVKTQAEAGANV